jgi:predicted nucleic acid-binding protein
MIVLDTNVLSELLKVRPASEVASWVSAQARATLFTTTITQAEMLLGVALLPAGKRRDALSSEISALFEEDFEGHVLPFDGPAARAYATLVAERRRAGKPLTTEDAQIAAIARSVSASVATRNTADFLGCGVEVIDPWA